ncbi:MAG: PIN domain-containing protein [Terricaulis sp.]
MKYDAITIDTQTAERQGYRFDSGLLARLKQFNRTPTAFVISDVVVAEIRRRLIRRTEEARDSLLKAVRVGTDLGLIEPSSARLENADTKSLVDRRLTKFLMEASAVVLPSENVPISDLLERYFASTPPFSESKKSEFPDAISLLSLERWASDQDRRVLAVSGDKDWFSYAASSSRIDVVKDLAEALSVLQEHADDAGAIIAQLLGAISDGSREDLNNQLSEKLFDEIRTLEVHATADGDYDFLARNAELTLNNVVIDDPSFKIVQVGSRQIAAQVSLLVSVFATAEFAVLAWGPEDQRYELTNEEARTMDEIQIEVLAVFHKDSDGDFSIDSVEIIPAKVDVDFGYIEPSLDEGY